MKIMIPRLKKKINGLLAQFCDSFYEIGEVELTTVSGKETVKKVEKQHTAYCTKAIGASATAFTNY